ncbi:hypothetical protein [uncultured Pluralibacter sp.]|uniref:hypothetical protein n=1 Tax=uncultured Pluralibacter sp. TaxID=1490864 RepID=UPI002609B04D|nr:hypothetical protein [uncultured Pluralibacter sp.]
MSDDSNTITSSDSYIKSTGIRCINAMCALSFWREFIAYFILGSMGLWLPPFLGASGANAVFDPMNVLTFGLVTLFIILEARLFMDKNDDAKSPGVTKLIVLLGVILLCIGYVKGVVTNGTPLFWGMGWVHISLFFTMLVWLLNHVNTSRYDPKGINEMLGGSV